MRVTEVNGAIAYAVATVRRIFTYDPNPSPELISRVVARMNYGKAPHHARRYVEGYAQALKDSKDATISS